MARKIKSNPKLSFKIALPYIVAWFSTYTIFLPFQDPINLPKFLILTLGAIWGIWLLIKYKGNDQKKLFPILILCLLILSILKIQTDNNLYLSLIGTYGRNDGFLSLAACLVLAMLVHKFSNREQLQKIFIYSLFPLIGLISYGIIQLIGKDFIPWQNENSRIVLTLGNPNFTSAFLGMASSAIITFIMFHRTFRKNKITMIVLLTFCLLLIYKSDSQQGLLVIGISVFPILCIYLKKAFPQVVKVFAIIYTFGVIFVILGIFGKAPLASIVYQPSISFRGDYWRAGINMFKDNLLFGVGIDNFGTNFPNYRDQIQVARNVNVNTDSAHNFFIQIAATQGIVLLALHIVFTICTAYYGIKILKINYTEKINTVEVAVVSMWISFQIQQLVSVENLGLKPWGWILTALVFFLYNTKISLHNSSDLHTKNFHFNSSFLASILSIVLLSGWLIMANSMRNAETTFVSASSLVIDKSNDKQVAVKVEMLEKALIYNHYEREYRYMVANELILLNLPNRARTIIENSREYDSDIALLKLLARTSLLENDKVGYFESLLRIEKLDPNNYLILQSISLEYCLSDNLEKANQYLTKSQSINSSSEDYQKAKNCILRKT